jgi:pimeloyl-ACP methyl ester carboxylesterase
MQIDNRPFDIAGPISRRSIVFIHGMRLTRSMWMPQMESLSSEYRVIALDLPGHGALEGDRFRLVVAVDQVARVIDEAAQGRALVVGLSLGGFVAMVFGAKYPKKAQGLVLVGSTSRPFSISTLAFQFSILLASIVGRSVLPGLNAWLFRKTFPPYISEGLIRGGFFFGSVPGVIWEILGRDFRCDLRAYPGPVLIVNGERDSYLRRSEGSYLAAAVNARLEIIPKAGHLSNLEQPQLFTEAIRRFARSLSAE